MEKLYLIVNSSVCGHAALSKKPLPNNRDTVEYFANAVGEGDLPVSMQLDRVAYQNFIGTHQNFILEEGLNIHDVIMYVNKNKIRPSTYRKFKFVEECGRYKKCFLLEESDSDFSEESIWYEKNLSQEKEDLFCQKIPIATWEGGVGPGQLWNGQNKEVTLKSNHPFYVVEHGSKTVSSVMMANPEEIGSKLVVGFRTSCEISERQKKKIVATIEYNKWGSDRLISPDIENINAIINALNR